MTDKQITNWAGKPFPLETVLLHVGKGWHPLVTALINDLFDMGWDGRLDQIKEKFGGLRFYIGEMTDGMWDRIKEAEDLSVKTCEYCGAPGKLRVGRWIKCRCDACETSRA